MEIMSRIRDVMEWDVSNIRRIFVSKKEIKTLQQLCTEADEMLKSNKIGKAIKYYETALNRNSSNTRAKIGLIKAYTLLGWKDRALHDLRVALDNSETILTKIKQVSNEIDLAWQHVPGTLQEFKIKLDDYHWDGDSDDEKRYLFFRAGEYPTYRIGYNFAPSQVAMLQEIAKELFDTEDKVTPVFVVRNAYAYSQEISNNLNLDEKVLAILDAATKGLVYEIRTEADRSWKTLEPYINFFRRSRRWNYDGGMVTYPSY